MPKSKDIGAHTCPVAFQAALDASDVIGSWSWDIAADRFHADALVALLFNVDPDKAEAGTAWATITAGIHAEDRARITKLVRQCVQAGSSYVAEYRVCSADGVTRWVLSRGRFHCDGAGRPIRGQGIIVDITASRLSESAFVSSQRVSSETLLERAADQVIAIRESVEDLQIPQLQLLTDMLLLEMGRALARAESSERRKRLN